VTVGDDSDRRLAANEDVFRKVNEGIKRGQWPGDPDSPIGFRCECARLGCNLLLALTLSEYETIRAEPARFVVLSGHELSEIDTVVDTRGRYVVVEKRGAAGAEAARRDLRS
jgi:hypothetical protein